MFMMMMMMMILMMIMMMMMIVRSMLRMIAIIIFQFPSQLEYFQMQMPFGRPS